jgi:protein TonB
MFNNLIESQSHRKELKRQSSFVLVTTAAYALFLFVAGIGSIYAYDARLDSQNTDLALLSWVPPVATATPATQPHDTQQPRRSFTPTARVDPGITLSERRTPTATTSDPSRTPEHVSTTGDNFPPVNGPYKISAYDRDPPAAPGSDKNGCPSCRGDGKNSVTVPVEETPPAPVKPSIPKMQTVSSWVLKAHAVSLPQPPYPPIAKQTGVQGTVSVQILVNESGKVVSAHAVGGHPFLIRSAEDAALRARFTPTMLSGQPVKVQGVITYNFVLQ